MQERNIVLTRGALAQVGSVIAGIGLLVGIVGFIWQGGFSAYVIASFVIGLLGIGLWAYMTPQEFKDFITGRQVKQGTVAFFTTLLLIGIVALLYILVQRQVITFDMTEGERFSLSNETMDILSTLDRSTRDILITAFYRPEDLKQREIDDQYFQLYEEASGGRISRRYIDPLEEPGLAEPYRGGLEQGANIYLSFVSDDGLVDFASTIPVAESGKQERDMTEAITRLLVSGAFKVYFETSMGEPDPLDTSPQGISTLNALIRTNGLITDPLSLEALAASGDTIPQDASAVIIARPTRQMTDAEIGVIDDYVQQGGSLFIMADVFFSDSMFMAEGSAFNDYIWEQYGLRPLDAVVVDPASSERTELDFVSYAVFSYNDIGANLNIENAPATQTLFRMTRVIEINENPPVNNGRVVDSSPFSWGERDFAAIARENAFRFDEGVDIQGPLNTVAWAFNQDTGSKLILVGDGEFVSNGQIGSPQGNATLAMDGIGWMTGFTEQVRFQPTVIATGLPIVFVDGQMLDIIAFITIILMPGIMLVLAGFIWMRRVRQ